MDARLRQLLLVLSCFAGPACAFDHSHAAWNALLKQHVAVFDAGKASRVDYAGMAQDRTALKSYLQVVSQVPETEFERWTRPQQMAFLIDAYNAFTVEKILTRYPDIRSIWDFGKLFGNPFKDEFFVLLGRKASLDWIEHERLRKGYGERRIHFALNCASVSCPMLREEAYVAERLERQLEEQAVRFLSDRRRNRTAENGLEVSRIFDWYKEDFEPRGRYFAGYAHLLADDPAQQARIAEGRLPLAFMEIGRAHV